MASVDRDGSNWRARWSVTVAPGKRRQYTRTFSSRKEAEQCARNSERLYEIRGVAAPQALTLATLVERFLAIHAARKRAATEHFYKMKLAYLVRDLGPVLLPRLTVSHLNDFLSALSVKGGRNGRPLSARTVAHTRRAVHLLLAFAVREKLLAENLAAHTEPVPTPRPKARAPTEAQITALLEVLAGRDPWQPFVTAALMTGARREELLACRWCDLDWQSATLSISRVVEQAGRTFQLIEATKSERSARVIGLDDATLAQLRAWRAR